MAVHQATPLIEAGLAERVVKRALSHGGDFAELFCEDRAGFGLSIDESRIERVQRGAERGAGISVIRGETSYFAHVDGLGEGDLERPPRPSRTPRAASAASPRRSARWTPRGSRRSPSPPPTFPPSARPSSCAPATRPRRSAGHEIAQVQASYAEGRRRVTVANSDGRFAADDRTRVRLGVQVVARRNGTVETGFETLGGHRGFELVTEGAGERIAERGGAGGAHPPGRRSGARRGDAGGGRRRLRRRPVPRDDGTRARGRPHPEGRLGVRGEARRAGRASPTSTPSTTAACPGEWGRTRSTTRARRLSGRR